MPVSPFKFKTHTVFSRSVATRTNEAPEPKALSKCVLQPLSCRSALSLSFCLSVWLFATYAGNFRAVLPAVCL